ncbi:MAG: patatin-like phospholipase family protein [Actinobacteria bacterium]|nr:patatin-like phospholipase family protein [Actinomycetota bacterium]
MKVGLVLGGGGLIGMGYHAGVLKALDEFGVDGSSADVMVGTSAGSVMAAYLAIGWTPSDFVDYANGKHPDVAKEATNNGVPTVFVPLYSSPAERVARSIGSVFAVASSRGYVGRLTRGRIPLSFLRHRFPSGLFSTTDTRLRLQEDLPEQWPDRAVYLCAADLYTGERVAFGHPESPDAPFPDAVLASTAIPGIFPPVKIGQRQYVDGGIVSATSLDLAVAAGCEAIVCIAPLGYRNEGGLVEPKLWGPMLVRSLFARTLKREVVEARKRGVSVLVIRPWASDLAELGTNSMRNFDRAAIVELSRQSATRLIERDCDHPALRAFLDHGSENRSKRSSLQ